MVKLDRSFLADVSDKKDSALHGFLLRLGVALGVEVVTEGVETEAAWSWLVAKGCDGAHTLVSVP